MKIVYCIFSFVFFLLVNTVAAQSKSSPLDSLKYALTHAVNDTSRCKILATLTEMAPDGEWQLYNEQLKALCEKNISANSSGKLSSFFKKYFAASLNNIGYVANANGDIGKGLMFYGKALKIAEEINDLEGTSNYLVNVGSVYDKQGDINNALKYYSRSLSVAEKIGNNVAIAYALNNIGAIYSDLGDLKNAIDYFERSAKHHEKVGDRTGFALSLNNIGLIYSKQNNNSKALEYYNKSLAIRKSVNDKAGIANSLNNIGKIYNDKGELEKALSYYEESLKIREEIASKYGIASSLNNIGGVYLKISTNAKQPSEKNSALTKAAGFCARSFRLSRELGYPENIKNSSGNLAKIYKELKRPVEALEMFELFIQMRDSISNAETRKAAKKQQFKYEWERREAGIKAEQDKKDIVASREKQQQKLVLYFVIGGMLLTFVSAGFLFNRFRITRRQKIIIEKQKANVDFAYDKLNEKNKEVMDSIRYAKRIQVALLTSEWSFGKNLNRLKKLQK
jgi:tetratricopeptide (TPR) repeat protein